MDFQTLKSNVESALGRSDVPDYVYSFMMADINRDLRILEMQASTTLSATSETVTLPNDFMAVESLYVDATPRLAMQPITDQSMAIRHDSSGKPYYYSVINSSLNLMPAPDGTYSLKLRYYTKLADFSGATDTNDVITAHPSLFMYSALRHAAVWKQDIELAGSYDKVYSATLDGILKADRKNRNSGPMVSRPGVKV